MPKNVSGTEVQVPGAKKYVWYGAVEEVKVKGEEEEEEVEVEVEVEARSRSSTFHLPPSTLHPPPSTLHPPPCTGCFVVGYRYRFRFFLCFINLCNSFIRTSPEYLREIPEFKGQVQNI